MVLVKPQKFPYSCGAASVANALLVLGYDVDEDEVATVAGTIGPKDCPHCKILEQTSCQFKGSDLCICVECRAIRSLGPGECQQGTDEQGILKAISEITQEDIVPSEVSFNDFIKARDWLFSCSVVGAAVILCVDEWDHWITFVGLSGDRILIYDSEPEIGLTSLSPEDFIDLWGVEDSPGELIFYGVELTPTSLQELT